MQQYPLRVCIPAWNSERCSPIRMCHSHISYTVKLLDCEEEVEQTRRYSNFAWLHNKLQEQLPQEERQHLPELPPKRFVGRSNLVFLERRRQQLEEYLQQLLQLKEVVCSDAIWLFLSAQPSTIIVCRFLCCPRPHDMQDLVSSLEKLEQRRGRFGRSRLAEQAVASKLVAFVRPSAGQAMSCEVDLSSRLHACWALRPALEVALVRQHLIKEDGIFGALLDLLFHAEKAGQDLRAPTECLQLLNEASTGEAMLHFCMHSREAEGLDNLARLLPTAGLHPLLATLLWQSMREREIASYLCSAPPLLGQILQKLFSSGNREVRLKAALCVSCLIREEISQSPEHKLDSSRLKVLDIVRQTLDEDEEEAQRRSCQEQLARRPSVVPEPELSGAAAKAPAMGLETAPGDSAATSPPASVASSSHGIEVRKFLCSLCTESGLRILKRILGADLIETRDGIVVDSVSALVVCILDCVASSAGDDEVAKLSPMVEPLKRLAEESDTQAASSSSSSRVHDDELRAREKLRTRARRLLSRICLPTESASAHLMEPTALAARKDHVCSLQVLSSSLKEQLGEVKALREKARTTEQRQSDHMESNALVLEPCVREPRLKDFIELITEISEKRDNLKHEAVRLKRSWQFADKQIWDLQCKDPPLLEKLKQLEADGETQDELECQTQAAREKEGNKLALMEEAREHAEQQRRELEESAANVEDLECQESNFKVEAESKALIVEVREGELARHKYERASATERRKDVQDKLDSCKKRSTKAEAKADQRQKDMEVVEAEGSPQKLNSMRADLERHRRAFRKGKGNPTEEEVQKLRALADRMPLRPDRVMSHLSSLQRALRGDRDSSDSDSGGLGDFDGRYRGNSGGALSSSSGTLAAPSWNSDRAAEVLFNEQPSLDRLFTFWSERLEGWNAATEWLRRRMDRARKRVVRLDREMRSLEDSETGLRDQLNTLEESIQYWADAQGRAAEARRAKEAAEKAQRMLEVAYKEKGEAGQNKRQADATADRATEEHELANSYAVELEVERSGKAIALEKQVAEAMKDAQVQLQSCRDLAWQEKRVTLLTEKVDERIRNEAECRRRLQGETLRLIQELQELHRQLDGAPQGASMAEKRSAEEPAREPPTLRSLNAMAHR